MFDGWYTSPTNQTADTEFTPLHSDFETVTGVYAKWLPFEDLVLDMYGMRVTIMDRNL